MRPIVNEYREGKVKSTPTRGVKCEAKRLSRAPAVKASLKRAFLVGGGRRETK